MRRKSCFEGISPWQSKKHDDDDDELMMQFCNQNLPKLKPELTLQEKINHQFNLQHNEQSLNPKMQANRNKRPNSNVQSTREGQSRGPIFDRLSTNTRELKSAQKSTAAEIKFQMNPHPLQEITVRNYIIEGSRESQKEQVVVKKKQSSYIMKQKFAQIRRSMNLQLGVWGCVGKGTKQLKLEKQRERERQRQKQNIILKHIRYELN